MKGEQISLFQKESEDKQSESCYYCLHFAEFKEQRTYANRDGEFGVFGMCCKTFGKNGSYSLYHIYIPEGKCRDFKQKKEGEQHAAN